MDKRPLNPLPIILLPILLALLLPGCGTKRTPGYPSRSAIPSRSYPDRNRIPPTQRPYTIDGKTYYPLPSAYGYDETGIASWYGPQFHGKTTSCGETYDMHGLTAAHKILPMNTRVLVKNLDNGREIVLRVNDRGPFVKDRIIDLSLGAATSLGMTAPGTARVRVTALGEAERIMAGGRPQERFAPFRNLTEGEFYVQIGAFANRENAERLKETLRGQGSRAIAPMYEQEGGSRYYRVQVWAGRTLNEARSAELAWEKHYPDAFVIAR